MPLAYDSSLLIRHGSMRDRATVLYRDGRRPNVPFASQLVDQMHKAPRISGVCCQVLHVHRHALRHARRQSVYQE